MVYAWVWGPRCVCVGGYAVSEWPRGIRCGSCGVCMGVGAALSFCGGGGACAVHFMSVLPLLEIRVGGVGGVQVAVMWMVSAYLFCAGVNVHTGAH